MAFLSSIFGSGSGASYQAPQANISNPLALNDVHIAGANQAAQQQQQQALVNALAAQSGLGNQASVFGQQQGLANQLQQESIGQGPNPAGQALANATGANVANQAALMAGQRGTGANAGLLARQAAQQGAGIQQNAIGQNALMQLQQQLAAQQQLQQQQGMMAGLANTQVGNQIQAQQNLGNLVTQEQLGQLGAYNQANSNAVSNVGQQNAANTQIQKGNQQAQLGILSGIGGALVSGAPSFGGGGAESAMMLSQGGTIPSYVDGGPVSRVGQHMMNMRSGGKVPGQAKVTGDSPQNDTVPAMVSPGEIVIPRSIAQSKNAPEASARFVAAALAKKGLR